MSSWEWLPPQEGLPLKNTMSKQSLEQRIADDIKREVAAQAKAELEGDLMKSQPLLEYLQNKRRCKHDENIRLSCCFTERIVTDPVTGGKKGTKLARFDLIPPQATWHEAEVYGYGATKYEDHNWLKGYKWSLSYAALQRHLHAFWAGEYLDPESGLPHLAHVKWHCNTLMTFKERDLGTDDRR